MDGKVISVLKSMPFICVPAPLQRCTSVDDSTDKHDYIFKEVTYRRERMRDPDSTFIEVLVASGVTNPIQRLIAGYKPTNDSAGEA